MAETMRCIEISSPGGPEVLKLTRRPVPAPGPGQALIRVAFAGVNRPDVLQRQGAYPPPPGASDLPGLEVAGAVEAVGPGVSLGVGETVTALIAGGGYAEYALAPAGACLPTPFGMPLAEAAGIPETFITVFANVYDDAGLKPSETLLVHGGTSGVGVAAITLAKALGSRVVATASSAAKLDAIRALGADAAFNYATDAWDDALAGGVDVVLDMTGGDFVARNLACLKQGGRHVSIAFLRGATAEINLFAVMRKRLRLSGSTLRARDDAEKARLAAALRATAWPLFETGRLKVKVDRVFPLEEAAAAHALMERGEHVGKIVLKA